MTSHLTLRARHAAHAFAALRLTGLGLPFSSTAAADCELRFLVCCDELSWCEGGDCEEDGDGERKSGDVELAMDSMA